MKAIVYYGYGSPEILRCEEIAEPSVGDDEAIRYLEEGHARGKVVITV